MSIVSVLVTDAPLESGIESTKAGYLLEVIQRLSLVQSLDEITAIVRHAARELVAADGATFVLRDENHCHYVDEEAIEPLWKGKRFSLTSCVSGWVMMNNDVAAIEDIYDDPRVPQSAYRPTFVKSMVMTPIRGGNPIGAIGTYWAQRRRATSGEIALLKALANSTSTALENVRIISDLRKSNEALEELLRSRDEFLSVAAHELRTPLSALQLQLQMTASDAKAQSSLTASGMEELRDDLDMALKQTAQLSHLTEQLLEVSRFRLHKFDLQLAEFDLTAAVRASLESFSPALNDAGCKFRLSVPETPVRGIWDQPRLEQVITNLLSNACKHAAGEPVEVELRVEGRDAILTVADRGPGIAKALHERIFERFTRAASSEHVGGLGLGLFIGRSIVRAHAGEIWVADQASGPGAIFTVRLPLDPLLLREPGHV